MASSPTELISRSPSTLLGHPILEGWMLKKKRKKMQGFARRYFYLSQEPAVLSYSFSPNSRIRDSVLIKLASISISRKSRSIHIDSGGSLVMHIKTLSDPDFLRWTQTLQSLVTNGKLKECQRKPRQAPRDTSKALPRYSEFNRSDAGPSVRPVELSNLYHSVARMQAPLSMLQEVQNDLRELLFPPQSEPLSAPQPSTPGQPRSPPTMSQPTYNPTTSPKLQYSTPKGKKQHLFKHYSHNHVTSSVDAHKVYQTITQAVTQLKTEHLNLIDLINIHRTSMISDQPSKLSQTNPRTSPSVHITRNPRQSTSSYSHGASASDYVSSSSTVDSQLSSRRRSSTVTKASQRMLQETSEVSYNVTSPSDDDGADSENDTVFHDAADDDLVFVDLDLINNGQETELEMAGNLDSSSGNDSDSDCSSSSPEEEEDSNIIENVNREPLDDVPTPRQNHRQNPSSSSSIEYSHKLNQRPDLSSRNSSASSLHLPANLVVRRRTVLPSPVCGDEFSIFSMLKKNVGKDLSQISFPISFNEPLSATQKICEECEYVDELLTKAVKSVDPIERLMYIAGFVVSGFCHTKTRAIRKPFNPMLGETFECIRPDKGMKFLSEKVVHHPPMIAAYAEGKNWKLEINSSARQKFWGQSLEIIPEGLNRLTIFNPKGKAESMDVYEWDKPSSFVRNLVSGTKYLEHIGKITIGKQNSSEKATVEFKPGSTFGGEGSRNKVEVKVYDSEGRVAISVNGKWDSYLSRTDTNQKFFEAHPLPARSMEFYGLTQFAIELNELTPDFLSHPPASSSSSNLDPLKLNGTLLPPSDSRLRPDLRLYENGKVDQADLVKKDLEEKQRSRRKLGELDELLPAWFELDEDGRNWVYKGGYFENRQKEKPEWKDFGLF
ncbi:hypothetical protein PGT21_003767 [Puccinia graminis f. sp. tritici]|uniref:PH domain-containing protein n=1 Tax=Puccinia graminis f. sp. tritici TaxID=56615 RepID=A0A5B0Q1M9_PUCGR|nr:hypothetical protein PGT21_003767 [Puccinia graminis f. sp. tritici]KAA1137236.1 hypothetical protein PGTUg99_008656 [Puccinia graminis f. sp. tritici]